MCKSSFCVKALLCVNAPSQNRAPHFVQACAVELHLDGHCTSATLYGNLQGKMPQTKTAPQTLCEPVQSKRTSTRQKSHFTRKFTGKRPPDRISPGHLQSWRPEKAKALFGGFTNRTVGITRFATQLLEEEVGMTHHESKKLVLKRENFPPKSCSSSSQSTFQSATSWMIIMHPTCCRNSPGLTLTLDLVLFIYHEILVSEANFMDGIT